MLEKQNRIKNIIDGFFRDKHSEDYRERMQDTFEQWISDPTDEREKDMELKKVWDEIWVGKATKTESKTKRGSKRSIPLRRVMIRVAAVVLPLMVIGGVWLATSTKQEEVFAEAWSIPNGVTENIALPDSTHIIVNSGSKLSVTQSKNERTVELSGESHFSVARDEKRPFVVKTDDITITVLGTEFNVEAYPDSEMTIVTLTKGKIALALSDGNRYTLTPNEQLVYNKTTKDAQLLKMSGTDTSSAWMEGKLVCEMKTLTQILNMVERRFNIQIDINPDVHLSNLRYTTEFNSDVSAENVLESLKIVTEQFNYAVNGKVITISKPENK